MMMMIINFN